MTDTTPQKRHRWSKDELAHLNRTVGHSKNKTEAFKKIADEMGNGMTWERVRSTYNNYHKPSAKKAAAPKAIKATKRTPSFARQASAKSQWDFQSFSDADLARFMGEIQSEAKSRIDRLSAIV